MRAVFGLFIMCLSLAGTALRADDQQLVVVELFTSQGCSSCPPADALLSKLAERDDILALALHVDYWDYIGWADSFARPEHTDRQKAYAHAAGQRSIYTPQMIVGGLDHIVGFKPMDVMDYVQMSRDRLGGVILSVSEADGKLRLHAEAAGTKRLPGRIVALLVQYSAKETVEITRGENAGAVITYTNIVTDMQPIGEWDGKSALDLTTALDRGHLAAIILQAGASGEILAAARLE